MFVGNLTRSFKGHSNTLFNPKVYITCVLILGGLTLIAAFPEWTTHDPLRFAAFFLIAAAGSSMKVTLPGVKGTMSVGFLFILVGLMELSLAEVLAIASVSVITQCI